MTINDNDIIETLNASRETGFTMLLSKYQEPVYWHIRRLVVSHYDAQDATQETFVRMFRSLEQFRGDSSLRTWLYRIATNEAIRLINSRRSDTCSIDTTSAQTIGNI